jgi:predicted RNase H-like HicB family nuclease
MKQTYTAMIQQSDGWWIGWVQEIRGINCQERTQEELLDSLRSAVEDMLELNRKVAIRRAEGEYQTVSISV